MSMSLCLGDPWKVPIDTSQQTKVGQPRPCSLTQGALHYRHRFSHCILVCNACIISILTNTNILYSKLFNNYFILFYITNFYALFPNPGFIVPYTLLKRHHHHLLTKLSWTYKERGGGEVNLQNLYMCLGKAFLSSLTYYWVSHFLWVIILG